MSLPEMQKADLQKSEIEINGATVDDRKDGESTDEAAMIISLVGLAGKSQNVLTSSAMETFGDGQEQKTFQFLALYEESEDS